MAPRYFHPADYCVLVAVLGLSTLIGVFFAWKDRRSTDKKDFFGGSKQMQMFPVTLSMTASSMSAIAILGVPAENFLHGSQHMVAVVGVAIASLVAAHVSLPVFYHMDMISVNQYLENRFNSVLIRKIISALTVIEVGFMVIGEPSAVFDAVNKQGLLEFFDVVGGNSITWISGFGMNQVMVQRYCGLASIRKARTTLSSGYNALAAIVWEDFIKHIVKLSPKGVMWAMKAIAAGFGLIAVVLAFLSASLPSVLSAVFVTTGSIKGATGAVFILGLLLPWCGSEVAMSSMFAGFGLALWVAVGRLLYPAKPSGARTTLEECAFNYTATLPVQRSYFSGGVYDLYHVSYMWIPVISFFVTLVVAISLTVIFSFKKSVDVDPSLISPCMRKIYLMIKTHKKEQSAKEQTPVSMKMEETSDPAVPSVVSGSGNGYTNHAMTSDNDVERTDI
ncbi:hypothetical protein HPB51_019828 [Rhipicephalus microplus]|uniref:Sodium/solute symporter n=1 Tax=Rhipicephalus microplus TaxID=6941 RepID=A0A9J6DPX9_RHIMP|nr:hypothetical protein HPB51_019828 [Rhipicephalus microplus]